MQTTKLFFMAALALTFAACSSDDNDIQNPAQPAKAEGIPFTATISIGQSASTRALTENGTTIEAAWAENDEVALIHNNVVDKVTVASVTGGVATITGTITGSPTDGDAVTVVYPYSAVDETTKDVKADVLAAQDGTLTGTGGTSIAENYDVRKGTGTLKVDGTATLNGNVSLTNQNAIFKFTIQDASPTPTPISVNSLTVFIGTQKYVITPTSATSELYAALPAVTTAQTVSFLAAGSDSKNYVFSKDGVTFAASKYYQSPLTMVPGAHLAALTGAYTVQDGETLTGTLNGSTQPYKITIADGATVTLDGVTINGYNSSDYKWAGITCEGDAIIILKDGSENTVKGFYDDYPGITCPVENTLTIKGETLGTGSLTASSNGYGAGIGGGFSISCGNIKIQGGVITATGVYNSPGIGAGQGASIGPSTCGTITISGGTVTAIGGTNSAGIGSGYASSNPSTCDAITISGGTVTATAGENAPAAIGKGEEDEGESTCASVTLGNITSVSMTNAAQTGLVGDFVNATSLNVGGMSGFNNFTLPVNTLTPIIQGFGFSSNLSGNTWTVAKNQQ